MTLRHIILALYTDLHDLTDQTDLLTKMPLLSGSINRSYYLTIHHKNNNNNPSSKTVKIHSKINKRKKKLFLV